MTQVKHWLLSGDVQKLVVVVAGVDSGETLERWQFNISVDTNAFGTVYEADSNRMTLVTVSVSFQLVSSG